MIGVAKIVILKTTALTTYNPDNTCPYLSAKMKALTGTKPRGFYKSEVSASVLTLDHVDLHLYQQQKKY